MTRIDTNGMTMGRRLMLAAFVPAIALAAASAFGASDTAQERRGQPAVQADQQGQQPAAQHRFVRASEVIGKEVIDPSGEKLGEIDDLIVDVKNQRVRYAVLSFGGVLGMGEKHFAYPVQAFRQARTEDALTLNVPKERLENSPGFDRDRWPDWNRDDYAERVDRFYGETSRTTPEGKAANQQLVRASDVIGRDVGDPRGEKVGEIEDLVVNMGNGQLRMAVLDLDRKGASDDGDRLLPLTLDTLTIPADRSADLTINVPADQIDTRSSFTDDAWPDFNDPAYRPRQDRSARPRT